MQIAQVLQNRRLVRGEAAKGGHLGFDPFPIAVGNGENPDVQMQVRNHFQGRIRPSGALEGFDTFTTHAKIGERHTELVPVLETVRLQGNRLSQGSRRLAKSPDLPFGFPEENPQLGVGRSHGQTCPKVAAGFAESPQPQASQSGIVMQSDICRRRGKTGHELRQITFDQSGLGRLGDKNFRTGTQHQQHNQNHARPSPKRGIPGSRRGSVHWSSLGFGILGLLLVSLAWWSGGGNEGTFVAPPLDGILDIDEALAAKPEGTQTRRELEWKYVVEGPPGLIEKNDFLLETMHQALQRAIEDDWRWKAPQYTNATYSIAPIGLGTFAFLDVYVDTDDNINEKLNIAHRIRYRWHSRAAFIRYMLGSNSPNDFPHRCEYQIKTSRDESNNGFYGADETRFEFRNESFPFKRDNSAPPAPWGFAEFIPPALHGHYRTFFSTSAAEYARCIRKAEPDRKKLHLKPRLIEIMTRRRMHLNMATSWGVQTANMGGGSMTNTTQAMVITLDTVEVYPAEILNVYFLSREARKHGQMSKRLERRLKELFVPAGTYNEIEFEFERNVETALHSEMRVASSSENTARLQEVERAFLDDQLTVSRILRDALAGIGLRAYPTNTCKYRKARQILRGEIKPWQSTMATGSVVETLPQASPYR